MNWALSSWFSAIVFWLNILIAGSASAQNANEIYKIGTDVGMEYLSEFSGRLRVTLILQECNFTELASEVGLQLPNSVNFFMNKRANLDWPVQAMSSASQVTRAYLLGYEVGVRTEFQREPSDNKKRLVCSVAAAAAGQLIR